jgi:hypothetical protein
MKNFKLLILTILMIPFSDTALSEVKCEFSEKDSKYISIYFKNTQTVSKKISRSICENVQSSKIEVLFSLWEKTILNESKLLQKTGIVLEPHIKKLIVDLSSNNEQSKWPSFSINFTPMGYRFRVDGSGIPDGMFNNETNEKCVSLPSYKVDCFSVLEDLAVAINTYKVLMILKNTDEALAKLKLYSSEWEKYFTVARSQTPLELIINSALYKEEIIKPTFVLPPDYQIIALHPNILLDYIDNADEGSQLKASLAVEWIGINYWNRNIPFGLALISTYSDRAGVDDVGHGVIFHINNNYSFGITNNDGETGFSFSMDLLKLFESKESMIDKYKKIIDDFEG